VQQVLYLVLLVLQLAGHTHQLRVHLVQLFSERPQHHQLESLEVSFFALSTSKPLTRFCNNYVNVSNLVWHL
jgi:hypothetical protein